MPGVIFSDNGSPNVPKVGQLQDVLQVNRRHSAAIVCGKYISGTSATAPVDDGYGVC